ncbi:protein phosphatase 1H-like [Mercenaria mercenaria]|uniref:protein phosphatase 1H-like n=1 Tax=Mercenaria mercenaria TaxID=6596 RepID=UPI00234F7B26|nr:protein phosphatase 1H-like [Mercenaria mercenaria]
MLGKFKDAAANVMSKYSQKNDGIQVEKVQKPEKYTYARPYFLGLDKDEVKCAQDFACRPVIKPRNIDGMILQCGYAECINGGKSDNNEDNAYACLLQLKSKTKNGNSQPASPTGKNNGSKQKDNNGIFERSMIEIASHGRIQSPVAMYCGIFDGHAGYQTSLIVSRLLHQHVQEKLLQCLDLILEKSSGTPPCPFDVFSNISIDDLIVGALEEAFQEMDEHLESEGCRFHVKGGCTTLVVLLLEGKMYIANAGDSRAVLCQGDKVEQVTTDFNPVTDKQRINYVGHIHPEYLHNEFTCLEFPRRLNKVDVGEPMLCRKPGREGWSYKKVEEDDLKFPLVTGEGKKARVMGTIGVTRGLGDHDLYVFDSSIWIKPFLSCKPEVRVIDLEEHQWTEDDVIILGTDGLWDVTTNQEAADIVHKEFSSCHKTDLTKYTIAAQELVSDARGHFTGQGWKKKNGGMGSFDDITVMIIPIKNYLDRWKSGHLLDSGVT